MEILALEGKPKCGKTTTLTIVHQLLLKRNYTQVPNIYKIDKHNDFIDIFLIGIEKVGIVSQGDYVRGMHSIANHLKSLKSLGCVKAICACTTSSKTAKAQVMAYPVYTFFNKEISDNLEEQIKLNEQDAQKIINALSLKLA